MQPKKNKIEQPGASHPEAVLKLLPLLETPDSELIENILNMIHENLCGTKDSRLLNGIVDYCIATESHRSIDILIRLKEPHDKHLFDKILELLKNENSRYKSLQLFMNLVYKQPLWLYKITNHRIMSTLLNILKSEVSAPNLICGLFILISLLPMIPSQFGHFLPDIFEIFSRISSWVFKKPSFMIDVYMLHLHITVYSLFHRLYGLFPCNFLAYLRAYYGGREYNEAHYRVFSVVIKPMLERVRLHPLLVTASKETELNGYRWKKMAYHDIIVECASVSLDFVEGTEESVRSKTLSSSTERHFSSLDSANLINCSNNSSCSITYDTETSVTESTGAEQIWSPNNAQVLTSPSSATEATSPSALLKNKPDFKNYFRQVSSEEVPLDIAVEAKPEVIMKEEIEISQSQAACSIDSNVLVTSSNTLEMNEIGKTEADDKIIIPAIEAKEDDIDKEVSELTSEQNSQVALSDPRHDTPFCSTTQNLTEKHGDAQTALSSSGRSDSFQKNGAEEDTEEMYNSIPESESEGFATFTRYRYFSHHGPPPDLHSLCVQKPKVFRSVSCPENIYPPKDADTTPGVSADPPCETAQTSIQAAGNIVVGAASTSAFMPVSSDSAAATSNRLLTYDQLIPGILNPLSLVEQFGSGDRGYAEVLPRKPSFGTLSPPQVLDRYIQLGSGTCLDQLKAIPITSGLNTDWTHFGGKPPADEVLILKNQILLLHNQLLFERHRKDVHSERNRRILGRAKRFKMQEEHIVALKDQISLLEQDNRDLKQQVEKNAKTYQQVLTEKQQLEHNLRLEISKAEQENVLLQYSNKEIKALLVSQKKENDEIREVYKRSQSEITLLKHQVERANKKALYCQKIEKDSIFLSKQQMLMQELISHYKDRIELLKETHRPDLGEKIMDDAAVIQVDGLKQKLEAKCFQFDSLKTTITQLEQSQAELKTKVKDHTVVLEQMKALHKDELEIREERLRNLKNVSAQKDAHILHLYKCLESVSEERRPPPQIGAASVSHAASVNSVEVADGERE